MLFILIGLFAYLVAGAPLVKPSVLPIFPTLRGGRNSSPCPYPSPPNPSPNSVPTLHVDSLPSSKTLATILTLATTLPTYYSSPKPPFRNVSMTSTPPTMGTGTVSFARSPVPTQLRSTTTVVASPVTSNKPDDVYHPYTGDGSIAAGWPSIRKWISFDTLWRINLPNMKVSCDQWQVARNSDDELDEVRRAIIQVSVKAGLDPRFVLAVVLQESQACVRVITTYNAHRNPGLMQSFNGTGSCNEGGQIQNPCPYGEIHQMIKDGTTGTPSGPGLLQDYQTQGVHGGAAYYRTARIYNSGSIPPDQNLSGSSDATMSYASDIANRLTGWVYPPTTFNG